MMRSSQNQIQNRVAKATIVGNASRYVATLTTPPQTESYVQGTHRAPFGLSSDR